MTIAHPWILQSCLSAARVKLPSGLKLATATFMLQDSGYYLHLALGLETRWGQMVPAGFRRLAWRPLPLFGVEIEQDLSLPLTDEQGKEFVRVLWKQGLVLARGQRLSMERQREICALAGPILLRAGESGYMSDRKSVV